MSHIFISYSRTDIDFAQKIVNALTANELDTWIDWKSIPKGEDWEQEIYRGIEEAEAFLFLISADSVASEMCNKEIACAIKNGKRILPVFIADVDDRQMYTVTGKFLHEEHKQEIGRRNFIKCREKRDDFNTVMEEIRTTIHTDYEWVKYHTKLQVKALEWDRRKDHGQLLRGKELRAAEQQLTNSGDQKGPLPTQVQRQYILASQRNEIRIRRLVTIGLVIGFVSMAALSFVAIVQRNKATRTAEVNQSLALSAYAQGASGEGNHDLALALAMEAVKIEEPPSQAVSMLSQIAFEEGTRTVIPVNAEYGVFRLAISPDGKYILSVSGAGDVQLWDSRSGKEVHRLGDHGTYDGKLAPIIPGAAFTSNGQTAITAGGEDIRFWDVETGSLIRKIYVGKGLGFTTAKFSQDTQYLVWGSSDGSVNFWDMTTGREISRLQDSNSSPIQGIDISPDNTMAIAGTQDGRVVLWDLVSGRKIKEFGLQLQQYSGQNQAGFTGVSFSPDGLFIAGGTSSGGLEIWNRETGQLIQHFDTQTVMGAPRFSPDANYLMIPLASGMDIWNVTNGQLDYSLQGHSGWVEDAVFAQEGRQVVSASLDGTIRIWDLASETTTRYVGHTNRITNLAISPADHVLLSSSWDGSVRYWDIETSEELNRIKSQVNSKIRSSVISPDGRLIMIAEDNGVSIFPSSTTEPPLTINGLSPLMPSSIGFIADGSSFYTTNLFGDIETLDAPDSTIQVRDTKTGKIIREFFNRGVSESITAVAVDHDGKIIVSANMFASVIGASKLSVGSINGWDVKTGEKILNIPFYTVKDFVSSMTISPDSKLLATGSYTGDIAIFNLNNGELLKEIPAHKDSVTSLAFSNNGKLLASSGMDQSIVIWNTSDWTENTILTTISAGIIYSLVFDEADTLLFGGTESGTILSWVINKDLPGTLAWIHQNRYIRSFTCKERVEYNLDEQCDSHGNLPTLPALQSMEAATPPLATPTKQSLESVAVPTLDNNLYTLTSTGNLDKAPLLFSFESSAGNKISLFLRSDQFDPYLILKDQDGRILRVNDDGQSGFTNYSSITDIEIKESGTYYIVVDSFLHLGETSQGMFELSVSVQGEPGQSPLLIQPAQRGLFGMGFEKRQNEPVRVEGTYDQSAAASAGIHPGDRILAVDGVETSGLSTRQIWDLLLVPVGASLDFNIQPFGRDVQTEGVPVRMTSNTGSTGDYTVSNHLEPGVKVYGSVGKNQRVYWDFIGNKDHEYSAIVGGMKVFTGSMEVLSPDLSITLEPIDIKDELGYLIFSPEISLPIQPKQNGTHYISITDQKMVAGESTFTLAFQNLVNQGNMAGDTIIQGDLSATDGYYWKFNAEKGRLMNLRFEFHNSQVEPLLIVFAPDGSVVGSEALDGFDKFTNEYNSEKLPSSFGVNGYPLQQTGEYTIFLLPYLRSAPVQNTGTYTLSFAIEDYPAGQSLTLDHAVTSNLKASEVKTFRYYGKKDEKLRITVTAAKPASSETSYFAAVEKNLLDTFIIVLDGNGMPLTGNDDIGKSTNSQVELTLPADGQYIFEIGTERDFGNGKFSILVEHIN